MWSCYVQVKIVREVHRITKRHRQNGPHIGNKKDENERHSNLVDSLANRIAGLILMAYAVCYIPGAIIYIWLNFSKTSNVLQAVRQWAETLAYLNSIFNPLLFSLQKKEIRQIVFSFVRSLLPCSTAKVPDLWLICSICHFLRLPDLILIIIFDFKYYHINFQDTEKDVRIYYGNYASSASTKKCTLHDGWLWTTCTTFKVIAK